MTSGLKRYPADVALYVKTEDEQIVNDDDSTLDGDSNKDDNHMEDSLASRILLYLSTNLPTT